MVVSPYGEVLAQLGDDEGLLVVDLDLAEVASARDRLPVLLNRRDLA
jgi:nitrilase